MGSSISCVVKLLLSKMKCGSEGERSPLSPKNRKKAEGEAAVDIGVQGAVNLAHACLVQLFNNSLIGNGFADHGECLHRQFARCNGTD